MPNVFYRPKYETKTFCDVWEEAEDFLNDLDDSPFSDVISTANQTLLYYLLYAKYGNSPIANRDENQFKYKVFGTIFQYGPTWQKRLSIQDTLRSLTEQQILAGEIEALTGNDTSSGSRNTSEESSKLDNTGSTTLTDSETGVERDISNTGTQTNENDGIDVTNHASNPPTSPVTSTTEALPYLDSQDYKTIDSTVTRRDNLKTDDDATTTVASTVTVTSAATISFVSGATVTLSDSSTISRYRTKTKDLMRGYAELWELLKTDVTGEFIKKFAKCFKQFVGPDIGWSYVTEEDDLV